MFDILTFIKKVQNIDIVFHIFIIPREYKFF